MFKSLLIRKSLVMYHKKHKIESVDDVACNAVSHLDCIDCTTNINAKDITCFAQCYSSGKPCKRQSLSPSVPFCLQHFMRVLKQKGPWPTHIVTNKDKLTMLMDTIYIVKNTARRNPMSRDNIVRNLYAYFQDFGQYGLDLFDKGVFDHAVTGFLTHEERIDTRSALPPPSENARVDGIRHTEESIISILREFGHPSIHILRQEGRWIDDRDMIDPETINISKQLVYIWCHDIGVTERLVELLSLRYIVLIGTFENFVRNGVPNNSNIFMNNQNIESICYLLPWIQCVGDHWMSYCISLESVDFVGLGSLEYVGTNWMYGCNLLKRPNFIGLHNLSSVGLKWMCACISLLNPNFTGLINLEFVSTHWMSGCRSLMTPDFNGLRNLEFIGYMWMHDCTSLVHPDFSMLRSLISIGESNCPFVTQLRLHFLTT
jgi:hypothetical protein